MPDRVRKQISAPSAVEPKLKLVEIGVEMLRADLMICTNDRTLEQRKRALNRIGVDLATYPFFLGMVHAVVRRFVVAGEPLVGRSVIGVDRFLALGRALLDKTDQRTPVGTRANFQPNLAAALDRTHHH